MIKITATIEEIQAIRPDLTREQLTAVLELLESSHVQSAAISYILNCYYPLTKSKPF